MKKKTDKAKADGLLESFGFKIISDTAAETWHQDYEFSKKEWDETAEKVIRLLRRERQEAAEEDLNFDEEEMAALFHKLYEESALAYGWKTQKECQTDFWKLPEANRKTMIATMIRFKKGLKQGWRAERKPKEV